MIPKDEAEKYKIKIVERDTAKEDAGEKIKQIKELLPNVVNSDNTLNTQALEDILDISKTTANNQGYELTFAGKGLAKAQKDVPTLKELKTELKQSKDFDNTENIIIRGDNLDVLKILKQNYKDKIKMIYIDPPYNTQSEKFIYNDNFKESEKALIEKYGLNEETVNYLHNIYGSKTHSGWLSFMYPRLSLARDLLKDDGVIFISIDDNEQANLKLLCDEIFGEENKLASLAVINNLSGRSDDKFFATCNEFCLVYAKNKNRAEISGFITDEEELEQNYDKQDEIGFYKSIGFRKTGNAWERINRPFMFYPVLFKDNEFSSVREEEFEKIYDRKTNTFNDNYLDELKDKYTAKGYKFCLPINENGEYGRWRWGREKFYKEKDINLTFNNSGTLCTKMRTTIENNYVRAKTPKTCWYKPEYGTGTGTKILKNLFNISSDIFPNPKSVIYLKDIINISTTKNDIILDFFAGSGTTAEAVMELNKEDSGKRKFILVQIDEEIKENKSPSAYKFCKDNKFEPFISSITIERVNRAGNKIKEELNEVDIGYKVFSLVEKPKIDYRNGQMELLNKRNSALDCLYNMMCANCRELTEKIQEIEKDKIYLIKGCYYILADCDLSKIDKTKPIYIDGWGTLSLEQFLNINAGIERENIRLVY
jgi:adenine-specific DNA-methyltransferase